MSYIDIETPELKPYESYKRLPPEEKEKYVKSKILEFLRLNKNKGLTIKQMSEATYFHRTTVAYHLDSLLAKGEVYKYPENSRNALFFPNGKFGDPILQRDIELNNRLFTLYLMSNQLGKFIYLQEKQIDIFGSVSVKGGIMIPFTDRKEFLRAMNEITTSVSEVIE